MKKLKYIIKYSNILYKVYFYSLSFALRFVSIFIKTDNNLILFNSFGGRKYDDSPKAIFEKMIKDDRFENYTLVWSFINPNEFEIPKRAVKVKDYSLRFFIIALKARVWITNSSMEHGLSFKKKETLYFNTWHGTGIKYIGIDAKIEGKSFKGKGKPNYNVFLSQSKYDEIIFKRAFEIDDNIIKRFGLPRNDELVNTSKTNIIRIKKELNIDKKLKIILYAPTFREFTRNLMNEITQDININLNRWNDTFSDKYILLVRVHYEVAKMINFKSIKNVIDVSNYKSLNDLLLISDLLISDYSSIFFDYSILHKPMLCYAYDYDDYVNKRGMYIDIKKELPCKVLMDENELFIEIEKTFNNYKKECDKVVRFQQKYVTEYGHASEKSCEYIDSVLNSQKVN